MVNRITKTANFPALLVESTIAMVDLQVMLLDLQVLVAMVPMENFKVRLAEIIISDNMEVES